MERTLVLVRHAKSDWSGGEPDIDRPLAPRGRRQAPVAGRWLEEHLRAIDLAVVSAAMRARSTWALIAAELDSPPPEVVDDRVYAASSTQLLSVVRELPDDAAVVALVGHNPGLEDLVELLTGTVVPLKTSALAVLSISAPWSVSGLSAATLRAAGRPPTAS
jgi:phosphohistidine phosphatase